MLTKVDKLYTKILAAIEAGPRRFDMENFITHNMCGTALCNAGFVLLLFAGYSEQQIHDWAVTGACAPTAMAIVEASCPYVAYDAYNHYDSLDLEESELRALDKLPQPNFYTDNEFALIWIREAARREAL